MHHRVQGQRDLDINFRGTSNFLDSSWWEILFNLSVDSTNISISRFLNYATYLRKLNELKTFFLRVFAHFETEMVTLIGLHYEVMYKF